MNKIALYVLTGFLLLLSAYLRSPLMGVSSVALWAVDMAAVVLMRNQRDGDIVAILERMQKAETKLKSVESDVNNVAQRAATILGETYR